MTNSQSRVVPQQQHQPPASSPLNEPVYDEVPRLAPGPLYIARYGYSAVADEDMSFSKGDLLYIIGNSEGKWWKARSKTSNKEGYVPCNYIEPVQSLEEHK